MPFVNHETLYRWPVPVAVDQRYSVGWQDARKEGPCFVVVRNSAVTSGKVLERFPLTEDGWVRAWGALVKLDPDAAEEVAKVLAKMHSAHAAQAAEAERQARVHEKFASAGPPSVFPSLDVQVLAQTGEVYTIGEEIRGRNTSRLLGPLAGAQAVVTDGSQAWSPGRAMFLPVSFTGLATKTKADAVVIFADGSFRTAALDGNNAVREAQKQTVQFNGLAGASAPDATERGSDPAAKLRKLQELRDADLLTRDEYEMKRAEVIRSI